MNTDFSVQPNDLRFIPENHRVDGKNSRSGVVVGIAEGRFEPKSGCLQPVFLVFCSIR